MNRRHFLGGIAATSTALAGCTGGSTDDDGGDGGKDSDGDGVADSEDYAPNDSEVQKKADVVNESTTSVSPTTATTTTATTTTESDPATTTVEQTAPNAISVERGLADGESQITEYSSTSLTAQIEPNGPNVGRYNGRSVKLLAFVYTYPRDEGIAYEVSDSFELTEATTKTVQLDLSDAPTGERLHYTAFLLPGEKTVDDISISEVAFFHETDPFTLDSNGAISRSPHPDALGDDSGESFERRDAEGVYDLSFTGSTQGTSWSVGFYMYKSSYHAAVNKPRGRSRAEYVAHARNEGFADELAGVLADEAAANGFTDKRLQVEFVIDFVQNLAYVPDDVSKGFDDYTKFLSETLCEIGGDCEDTSILLAAVLQAESFGYDMILIEPPGHMAAGIKGASTLPGNYWTYRGNNYYYIETTGSGWGIGDLPDTYKDAEAYVYQV